MADANELVAPRLGLGQLPVVEFPDDDEDPGPGLHWKTRLLTARAGGRPFVWLDDEIADADRRRSITIIEVRLCCTASIHSSA
jgi:hypothetical protein